MHPEEEGAEPTATRRRGAALEQAILDAAWEQLAVGGYTRFTMEAVAERAATARTVLYRRWPTRGDLLRAAIQRYGDTHPLTAPDTGSLRDDTLAALTLVGEQRIGVWALFSAHLGAFHEETGTTPEGLRSLLASDRATIMQTVVDQAVARGEYPASAFTPRIVRLPFDLFRVEALMNLRRVPSASVTEIVDDVFIPLVEARARQ